uniref:Uncharacterized protein n=1 Tax=Eutreptiella gymnastica TaxID=73025 RepID=A0A7S1N442_9EUGL
MPQAQPSCMPDLDPDLKTQPERVPSVQCALQVLIMFHPFPFSGYFFCTRVGFFFLLRSKFCTFFVCVHKKKGSCTTKGFLVLDKAQATATCNTLPSEIPSAWVDADVSDSDQTEAIRELEFADP